MSKIIIPKPILGQRFTVTHTLDRVKGEGKSVMKVVPGTLSHSAANCPLASTRDWYLKTEAAQPFEAMYIGYRYVKDGHRRWESEVGYIFSPISQQLAYLLVYSPSRKPVLALPEHCSPIP